jgi:AcrR family transcriptional regulator
VSDVNTSRRGYDSPLRRRQAAATRAAVLAAARELFLEQGYGATTVEQVAARAGVSKPTVFTAVGNKQTLLKVVRDVAMAGDDEPVPVNERPLGVAAREEPDQERAIPLAAASITGVNRRYAGIDGVLRGAAAAGEDGLRELWETSEQQRLAGARFWLTALVAKAPEPPGFDFDAAADQLWIYMAPDLYARLVEGRGWSHERVEAWLVARIRGLLGYPESP